MPRAALQADEIAAFRRRLTDAATRLFAAHGYEAVTMRAVADQLGVSAMTPYRYVAGKDELFALVRAEAFRRFADRLETTGQSPALRGDPLARLRRLKRAYIDFAIEQADAYRIMFELQQPAQPIQSPELAQESRRAFGSLHDAVRDAVDAGELTGDPLVVAQLLWASTHGLVSLALAGRISARALAQLATVDHELAGFRPDPPLPRRTRTRTPRTRSSR
jgi:AcrR family transcriptional regulator